MDIYDKVAKISLVFTHDKLNRIAGDTISLDNMFDAKRDLVNIHALDSLRFEISASLTRACIRTTDTARLDIIVNTHMPLFFKNHNGSIRGLRDNSKISDALIEFVKNPNDGEFIIYIDCGSLFFHPDYDEYDFGHVGTDKKDFPNRLHLGRRYYTQVL